MPQQSNAKSSEKSALVRRVVPFASDAISKARLVSDLEPGTRTVAFNGCGMGLISSEVIVSMFDIYAALELKRIRDFENHSKTSPI